MEKRVELLACFRLEHEVANPGFPGSCPQILQSFKFKKIEQRETKV